VNKIFVFALVSGLTIITASGQNAPVVISPTSASAPNGIAPNGIGVTTNELLFSQPYCQTANQDRGIYSLTNLAGSGLTRSGTVSGTIRLLETGNCAENYFIISTGSGGFTAGAVYSTGWNATNSSAAVYKNGALFIDNIDNSSASSGHAGITFDTIGTFHSALIVTTPSTVIGFDKSGNRLFSYPPPSGYLFESATVAPISNVSCPGCLYLTAESVQGPGAIYVIEPVTPSGTPPTLLTTTPNAEPENILFVDPLLCTLNGTEFAYFVSAYAAGNQISQSPSTSGALLAFTAAQLAPFAGQFLVPFENGTIYAFNGTSGFTPFSTNLTNYQLEGASLVQSGGYGAPRNPGYLEESRVLSELVERTRPSGGGRCFYNSVRSAQ
jgi:hypothetical protein